MQQCFHVCVVNVGSSLAATITERYCSHVGQHQPGSHFDSMPLHLYQVLVVAIDVGTTTIDSKWIMIVITYLT